MIRVGEGVLDKLVCPSCLAGGLSCGAEAGPSPRDGCVGTALACRNCGAIYPFRDGILDLAVQAPCAGVLSLQWLMELTPVARLYEKYLRPLATMFFSDLSWEMGMSMTLLDLSPGLDILDLACGPGNFTRLFSRAALPGKRAW